jgi:hypothetical protein
MPPAHAIQATFGGGEIAPALQARTDLAKYQSALKRARNMLVAPQGGAYNRAGFKYVATAKDSAHPVRFISFEFSTSQAYTLELGHLYARFYTNSGQIQTSGVAGWVTTTAYKVGDLVTQSGTTYYCLVAHTAGVFATDLAAAKWYAQTGTIYEIPTPWAGTDLFGLKLTQSNDVLYLCHPSYAPQTLTRYGATNWQVAPYAFQNGPFMLDNTDQAQTLSLAINNWQNAYAYDVGDMVNDGGTVKVCSTAHTSAGAIDNTKFTDVTGVDLVTGQPLVGGKDIVITAAKALFQAGHVGALFKISHAVMAQTVHGTFTAANQVSPAIRCGSTWRIVTHGGWGGTILVQKSTDNGLTWSTLRTLSSQTDVNFDTSGQTGEAQCLVRMQVPSAGIVPLGFGGVTPAWSGTAVVDMLSDGFTWNGIAKITAVTDTTHATAKMLTPAGFSNSAVGIGPTFDWAEGAWSTYRGWPACCAFFQDRLWLSDSPTQPETLWGSALSGYQNHGVSEPLVDSDAININLPSQRLNAVQSLAVLRDLLALTSSTDWGIQSSSGVVTPTTVQAVPQGQRGAAAVQPIVAGLRAIIVQPMGTVVRDLGFSIYTNSYDGNNLSLIASHLFTGYTIVDMCYQQEPDSIIWLVRSDGVLLSLTYLFEQEVVAWTWHDTAGKFESICSIPAPGGGYNQLWAVVNRGGTRTIEVLDQRMASTDPADQFFVDCGLKLNNPVAITGMTVANPVVVTAPAHGFNNGDIVDIDGTVVGMDAWTDASGNVVAAPQTGEDAALLIHKTIVANGYKVANKTANTFELQDANGNTIDGTALGAYVSGGNARKQVTAVSGLPAVLEGKTVSVLANGFVQAQKVVAGGAINLDTGASRVAVGLPYTADLETLSFEQPQQDGTLQGRKVKMAELTMRLLNSAGGQVMQGEDVRLLDPIFTNNPPATPGKPNALFTGDLAKVQLRSGYDYGAHIWVRQSDPLPIHVLGLMPMVVAGR